jgi:thiamine biosynthesis lipoprotein
MTARPSKPPQGSSPLPRALLALVTVLFLASGCARSREPFSESRFMMGTLVDVIVYGEGDSAVGAAHLAFDRMAQVERAADSKNPASPLKSLMEGKGSILIGDAARIMETAMSVAVASSGAFDPTLGELVKLWGIGMGQPKVPNDEDIASALERSGYRKIPRTGCCSEGVKAWLDLGGVAKGYAVDEAVKELRKAGIGAGIVNAGGDLRSFGAKPGKKPWKIGIQDPDDPQELAGVLDIGEMSVATSGDYQRYFEEGGVRYHHILDASTGRPARSGVRSATVLAPDCALADALATAAFVMGPGKGLELLEHWPGVEGILISEDGAYHLTSGIGTKIPFEKKNKVEN